MKHCTRRALLAFLLVYSVPALADEQSQKFGNFSVHCYNEFALSLLVESEIDASGERAPKLTTDSAGEVVPVVHTLATPTLDAFRKLETRPRRPGHEIVPIYDRGFEQTTVVAYKILFRFELDLPSELPNELFPLAPENAVTLSFSSQYQAMIDLYRREAESGERAASSGMRHPAVSVHCSEFKPGFSGSNN